MMITFYKVLGWLSIGIACLLILLVIISGIVGESMPYYIAWKFIFIVPFALIYGLRQLRKAKYQSILKDYGIDEKPLDK